MQPYEAESSQDQAGVVERGAPAGHPASYRPDTFKSQRVYLYLKKSDSIDKNIIATLKLDRNTIRLTKTISLKDYVAASFLSSDG